MSGRGDHPGWFAASALSVAVIVACLPVLVSVIDRWRDHADVTAVPAAAGDPFVVAPPVRVETRARRDRARAAGVPVLLMVPSLHIRAQVVPVGAPDRVLLPPADPRLVGWWRNGAVPGAATGGALLTAHTVHTGGGAFDDLETLRYGDPVRVRTARGTVAYRVSAVTVYRKATLARDAQRVFSQSVPGRLVLITCEDWNGSEYLSNAVVFADRL